MTVDGIIIGGLTGLFVGGFCGLLIANTMEVKKFGTIVILAVAMIFFGVLAGVSYDNRNKTFNHGYCVKCDTKYEAITRKSSSTYYECPECYFGTWH